MLSRIHKIAGSCFFSLTSLVFLTDNVQADLVTHLTFDDASNLSADISGNNNHATSSTSPMGVSGGISGGAVSMNSDYFAWIGKENPVESVLEGSFTFSVWANTTSVGPGSGLQAHRGDGIIYADIPGNHADSIPMALNGSKLAGFWGTPETQTSISDINTGQWVHLVVTRDVATDGRTQMFIDGLLEVDVLTTAAADVGELDQLILGGNTYDGRYFDGLLDDFQVYDSALNAQQVSYLHSNPGSSLSAVPEPSSGALVGLAVGLAALSRRRRSRVKKM